LFRISQDPTIHHTAITILRTATTIQRTAATLQRSTLRLLPSGSTQRSQRSTASYWCAFFRWHHSTSSDALCSYSCSVQIHAKYRLFNRTTDRVLRDASCRTGATINRRFFLLADMRVFDQQCAAIYCARTIISSTWLHKLLSEYNKLLPEYDKLLPEYY